MPADGPDDLIPRPDPTSLTASAVTQAKEDLRREIGALREVLEAQIATVIAELHQTWKLHEADIQRERVEREALKEVIFDKFHERDLRFAELDNARKEALDMALRTARELVDTKAMAAQAAADKFQEAIVRQLEDATRANTESRARLATQVTEIDKRITGSEGTQGGAETTRADLRNNIGVMIAAGSLLIALILGILLYAKK